MLFHAKASGLQMPVVPLRDRFWRGEVDWIDLHPAQYGIVLCENVGCESNVKGTEERSATLVLLPRLKV